MAPLTEKSLRIGCIVKLNVTIPYWDVENACWNNRIIPV